MGGCRCTYRNCSLRTDGKTHMFHYPVFDKVRCHQWLTNAHKLEFLNLKVSQLKNRVVCQHHFKDENFMNFRKDKLTFDAVPTEDGPYCDSSQIDDKKTEQDDTKAFSISLDDIENDYLTIVDKKANFSVKYGDFLTNCDLMDLDSLNQVNDNNQIVIKSMLDPCLHIPQDQLPSRRPVKTVTLIKNKGKSFGNSRNIILNDYSNRKNTINQDNLTIHHDKTVDMSQKTEPQQIQEHQNSMNLMLNVSHVPIEFNAIKPYDQNQQNIDQSVDPKVLDEPKPLKVNTDRSLLKEKEKIKIISEKKILEPVPVIGKLEPVSPTRVLTFPNRKKLFNSNPVQVVPEEVTNVPKETAIEATETVNYNLVLEKSNDEPSKIVSSRNINASPENIKSNVENNIPNEILPNTLLIKNKIPPERVAAIAEKRKFNMKLRDIIEDCLDKLDEPEKSDYDKIKPSHKTRIMQSKKQQVGSYLAKEPELPNVQDYTIAYLEARMKKMENNLLNKIDENSQKIVELKHTISPSHDKKTVRTQTSVSKDVHKRQLYQELSKYLSREANSLIYEELFINKYTQQVPKPSPSAKRRKCR